MLLYYIIYNIIYIILYLILYYIITIILSLTDTLDDFLEDMDLSCDVDIIGHPCWEQYMAVPPSYVADAPDGDVLDG